MLEQQRAREPDHFESRIAGGVAARVDVVRVVVVDTCARGAMGGVVEQASDGDSAQREEDAGVDTVGPAALAIAVIRVAVVVRYARRAAVETKLGSDDEIHARQTEVE